MIRCIRWFTAVLVCFLALPAYANPASDLLFRGGKASLSTQDKEAIAKLVGLKLSKDQKQFVDDEGRAVQAAARELHLNADKIPEVLVTLGSVALFGNAGSGVQLYIKDPKGRYVMNLGFPAADVKVLPTRTRGYQDLQILGPGFQCPIWRWNGKAYDFSHKVKC
jgi:hypothetical protein